MMNDGYIRKAEKWIECYDVFESGLCVATYVSHHDNLFNQKLVSQNRDIAGCSWEVY